MVKEIDSLNTYSTNVPNAFISAPVYSTSSFLFSFSQQVRSPPATTTIIDDSFVGPRTRARHPPSAHRSTSTPLPSELPASRAAKKREKRSAEKIRRAEGIQSGARASTRAERELRARAPDISVPLAAELRARSRDSRAAIIRAPRALFLLAVTST